ncbi:hypothetical protein [Yoonia sp. MH D7]
MAKPISIGFHLNGKVRYLGKVPTDEDWQKLGHYILQLVNLRWWASCPVRGWVFVLHGFAGGVHLAASRVR